MYTVSARNRNLNLVLAATRTTAPLRVMRVLLLMACASVAHGASSIEKWAADLLRTEPWTMTYPPKWSPGGVVNLDADSFDPSINNGHPWMVMFHGPDASKVDEYYPYFNAWGKWASRQQHDLRFGAVECIWEHNDEGQATGAAKRNYQEICRLRMKIGYDMWPVFMVFLPDGTMVRGVRRLEFVCVGPGPGSVAYS